MKKTVPIPLAYFITFSCYGTHLHGDESGSVDRFHNRYGMPFLPPDEVLLNKEADRMKQDSYIIDNARASVILNAIRETARYRQWNLLAAHVRSTHVHIVIQALIRPEKVLNDLKAYASRALNQAGYENSERRRWTRHGSTRYLWKVEDLEKVTHYVLHEQGEAMSVYENKNTDIEAIFRL